MRQRNALLLISLSVLLSVPCGPTFGQVRGRVGGAGTTRGVPSPRSGLECRSNPIANPAPSLTPSEVLNPRGSLSAGQVLNPKPSLNRPRTGGASPEASRHGATAAVLYQAARPIVDDKTSSDAGGPPASPSKATNLPAGEQILIAVVALDGQIGKIAPKQEWSKHLSLDTLRAVPVLSERPANDEQRAELEKILKTYQAVGSEDQSTSVSSLPEFKQTLEAIQQYLSPMDVRLRQKTAASFQQLASDLMWYKNGAPWVEYLVPSELKTNDGKTQLPKELLEKQLKRYAKISSDPFYKKVSSLGGFKPAYDAVKALAASGK